MQKKVAFIVFIGIFGTVSVYTQTRTGGIITGRVFARNGLPLEGTNIYISNPLMGTHSDSLGNFVVSSIPKGTYALTIQHMFYHSIVSKQINISAQDSIYKEFYLEPTDTIINPDYSLYLDTKKKAMHLADSLCSEKLYLFLTLHKDSIQYKLPSEFGNSPYLIIKYDPLSNLIFREIFNKQVLNYYQKQWGIGEAEKIKRRVGF